MAARSAQSDARIRLPCSNLILKLAGIYDNHICTDVVGLVSPTSMVNILANVRSKVLDLTIAMEKAHPDVRKVSIGKYPMPSDAMTTEMNHAFYQTVHGGDVINNIFYLPGLERIVIPVAPTRTALYRQCRTHGIRPKGASGLSPRRYA